MPAPVGNRPSTSDEALVVAARAGSRDAYGELVERYQGRVGAIAYAITGSAGDEIVQETFVEAWRKLPEMQRPALFAGWICGIARNMSRRFRRAHRRHGDLAGRFVPLQGDEIAAGAPSPLDVIIGAEEDRVLSNALMALPEEYRLPLVMFYQEQQSIRKVAEALDLSAANVGLRLYRGRRMLQEKLAFVASTLRRVPGRKGLAAGVLAALAGAGPDVPAEASPAEPVVRPVTSARRLAAVALPAVVCAVAGLMILGRPRTPSRLPPPSAAGLATLATFGSALTASSATRSNFTDDRASTSLEPVEIFSFDFEDGALPPHFGQGQVVATPPSHASRFCLLGTVNPTWPTAYAVAIEKADGTALFSHSENALLTFDYWIGDENKTLVDGRWLPNGFGVTVRDLDKNRNYTFYLRDYALGAWNHAEVPLSEFDARQTTLGLDAMEPGDRVGSVELYGGKAGGQPLLIDNIKLVIDPAARAGHH